MAELQWIIEVRCTNALLAEIKVGERGEHAIVNIPDRRLDPSEFDKVIEGLAAAQRILQENGKIHKKPSRGRKPAQLEAELGTVAEIERRSDLYQAKILSSGELVSMKTDHFFAPSELYTHKFKRAKI